MIKYSTHFSPACYFQVKEATKNIICFTNGTQYSMLVCWYYGPSSWT